MLSTAYYFLQVILCSAIMMGYYWMALRNKRFHQYNRFYLMAVALLSWTVPLIKIQWITTYSSEQQVIRLLSVVADNNSEIEAVVGSRGFHWSLEGIAGFVYLLMGSLLLILLIKAFYRIYVLLKTHSCRKVEDVYLIITKAEGTPFSFFRYIFWNEEIDIRSASGKQILQHELTHVQQKHSVDKLLIQLMLIPGWFNPFFWLLKKEMEMIHEFIADKKAVGDGDTAALAQMLLTAVYPKHRFDLTHPFFFSPIKRRLQMLTNHKNPRFSYIRRLVILPLLAVVIVLFAFRNKEYRAKHPISVKNVLESVINDVKTSPQSGVVIEDIDLETLAPMKLSKTYRIIINPGHGGEDVGARGTNGITESVLTLQLAKMLKEKNNNPQLDIILTRSTDEFQNVVQVAEKTNALSPDLFVSIHLNSAAPIRRNGKQIGYSQQKGAEIYVADKEKAFDYDKSYQLANWIGNVLIETGTTFQGIKSRNKGIYVLQAVKSPAVLVEAGYITHREEAALLQTVTYQEKIVSAILQGIEQYLATTEKMRKFVVTDMPISEFTAVKDSSSAIEFMANRLNLKEDKQGKTEYIKLEGSPYFKFRDQFSSLEGVLFLLDGKKVNYDDLRNVSPDNIQEIKIIKDQASIQALTNESVTGVIQISSKQSAGFKATSDLTKDGKPINFTASFDEITGNSQIQRQEPVSFPGGELAWQKYLLRNLNREIPVNNGADTGKYIVKVSFIVDKQGNLSDIKVIDDPGYGTAAEVVRLFAKGPRWKPATINGKPVVSRFEKKVTFVISDADNEENPIVQTKDVVLESVYMNPEVPPYFPGKLAGWVKYLGKNLDHKIVKKNGGPRGVYTVIVNFQVDENGKISNIRSNDPGYGTKEEAVRMIKNGPNWVPAINKGKHVRAEHRISISFNNA
jgi:N-acetylmuramoyl-L-alanine amidase